MGASGRESRLPEWTLVPFRSRYLRESTAQRTSLRSIAKGMVSVSAGGTECRRHSSRFPLGRELSQMGGQGWPALVLGILRSPQVICVSPPRLFDLPADKRHVDLLLRDCEPAVLLPPVHNDGPGKDRDSRSRLDRRDHSTIGANRVRA